MSLQELQAGMEWGQLARTIINTAIRKIKDASTTVAGLVRLATNPETTTGTSTTLATTPAGVKAVIDALKAAENTFTAAQTIEVTAAGTAFTIRSTDAGAGSGPHFSTDRNSSSPAAGDFLGTFLANGRTSTGATVAYAYFIGQIIVETNGATSGRFIIRGQNAGADAQFMACGLGVQIGNPTGNDPGYGNLNVDGEIRKDGTKVVGARRTGWAATTGTELRTNFGDASLSDTSQALRALIVDLKAHGLIGA
jgi:hypothetical protein